MREDLAANLRRYRGRMTQPELSERSGVSVETIRKIEQAAEYNPTLNLLVKLATALDIPLSQLVKVPAGVPSGNPEEGVMALRRVLSPVDDLTGMDPYADVDESRLTIAEAEREAGAAWGEYWSGKYEKLTALLPATIAHVRATAAVVPAHERARADELLSRLYWCTGCTLVHLGHTDPAWLAIRLARESAEHGKDELLDATIRGSIAWQLLVQGRYTDAHQIAIRAAMTIEPGSSPALPALSAYGSLVITAATAAGRDQRVEEARDLISHAREIAARIGVDRHDYETYFGPSQVVMQSVDVAVVTEDYETALELAKDMPRDNGLPLASRCRHLADKALALTRTGHYSAALDTLLTAEAQGQDWIQHQSLPKRTTEELLDRDNKASRLRTFAKRIGVAV
ncbi:helix-turn-helix transcriptional regulator [Amycolatopsis rubida]|uniref:DNA-binding transcriptional regulator, XRE-family HTH domain n=1 Tax=Amycolatopsis rubida TaxID=112413 RepID=A0A1I5XBK8_9PSEU|nr:helix-turn-helix transcriptional regulator [Amycolatopsis rubida]SFQ29355.1 DNA-binding transcriptional regulator, XRE-family HTH domain [Amycolatopsis rubida]